MLNYNTSSSLNYYRWTIKIIPLRLHKVSFELALDNTVRFTWELFSIPGIVQFTTSYSALLVSERWPSKIYELFVVYLVTKCHNVLSFSTVLLQYFHSHYFGHKPRMYCKNIRAKFEDIIKKTKTGVFWNW